jgi:glycosyltransferase involved in cell wall biosynthesis
MNIAIATVQAPFVRGGAELHARGLLEAVQQAGYQADIVTIPFSSGSDVQLRRTMDVWENEDFTRFNGCNPDIVVCLKFPTYYLRHPEKRLWLLHQHRAVYDLWQHKLIHQENVHISASMKKYITKKDTEYLSKIRHRYTNSRNVGDRLRRFNHIESKPLYHPPFLAEAIYTLDPLPYVFFPSRLERLKRQNLLIEAMRHVRAPVKALIAGTGGQMAHYAKLIETYGLTDKVRLLGEVTPAELLALYAHCLGVFFGPLDEDYGYVTIEAMIAAKPVITCSDSGGPLEFVENGETGYVTDPEPEQIAAAIESLASDYDRAREMGRNGREKYDRMGISWENVLMTLTAGDAGDTLDASKN